MWKTTADAVSSKWCRLVSTVDELYDLPQWQATRKKPSRGADAHLRRRQMLCSKKNQGLTCCSKEIASLEEKDEDDGKNVNSCLSKFSKGELIARKTSSVNVALDLWARGLLLVSLEGLTSSFFPRYLFADHMGSFPYVEHLFTLG